MEETATQTTQSVVQSDTPPPSPDPAYPPHITEGIYNLIRGKAAIPDAKLVIKGNRAVALLVDPAALCF